MLSEVPVILRPGGKGTVRQQRYSGVSCALRLGALGMAIQGGKVSDKAAVNVLIGRIRRKLRNL